MAGIKKSATSEKGHVGHQVTGKVAILYGAVKAVSPDGTVRMLKVNSPVFADDHIITGDDGNVSIVFDTFNHTQLDLGRMSNVVIDEDVYGIASPGVSAEASAQQEAIQAALLAGDQPVVLDATAAGGEANAGGDHPVYVVTPDWVHVTPESGAETIGVTFGTAGLTNYDPTLNSIPTITVDPGNPGGANDIVHESGLPSGSSPDAAAIHAAGTFTVSDADGLSDIQSVTISGTTIAIANLGTGNVIHGVNGDLTITGFDHTTGIATYTYDLTSPATNAGGVTVTNSFTLTTTDGSGATSAPATITIEITDDTPVAHNDTPSVTEDAATHLINGNVLDNDAAGADAPKGFTAWGTASANTAAIADLAKYGTLHLNADGSWSFDLNNSLATVQALKAGQVISDSITYTMHDADGSTSTAALTITINGTNDTPHIVTDSGNPEGANDIVHESGLPSGSSPDAAAIHAAGTFTVSDADGLDDIQSVTISGTTIAIANLGTGNVIHGANGDLTITGFDHTTGIATYTYDLTSPATNVLGADAHNSFQLTTTDGSGATSAPATITIDIINDTPTAANDNPAGVTEDAATHLINGNVLDNDAAGADVPKGFTAWDATTANTAAIADLAKYGTLHLNTDGSWSFDLNNSLAAVQALKGGQVISDSITYTMHDADGDTSGATLKITINGADDTAHVYTAAASGPDATVAEHGLVAADGTQSASGTFTVSATDGIHDVVFTNPDSTFTTLSADQLNALSTTHQDVNTGEGILHLTGYDSTTGVVNYTYTLAAAIDNAGHPGATGTYFDDSVHITVNGIGGTTAGDDLVIRITDDTPTAANDNPAGVTEDAATHLINGNVLDNDAAGADVPKGFTAWDATTANTAAIADLAKYGTLHLNTDGSWSFDLNNSLAAVQALKGGQVISDSITYTMHDADGDTSGATLKITINGADDTAHVYTAAASGPDATVAEHGLVAADGTQSASGTFTVSATDGIHDVVFTNPDSTFTTLSADQLNALSTTHQDVNTGEGILHLTGYDSTTGVVNYTYTLAAAIDNAGHPGATGTYFDDSVHITVNGIGGTTAGDDLVIRITDDTPTAANDNPAGVTEDAATHLINGNVLDNDAAGADVPKGFTAWDATTANTAAIADLAKYGTLHLNTDGSWSFDLNNSLAAVQALKGGQVISDSITYTMHDADGDTSGATLKITINGADDTAHVYTAAASGPDATVAEHGLVAADGTQSASGTFTVSATDGIHDVVFTNPDSTFTTLSADQLNALSTTHQDVNTGEGILHLTGYDSTTGVVNYTYTLAAAIDNAGHPGATGTYFDDSVHITVNGIGGTTAGDDLVIRITDDTPTAANDNPAGVTEDAATHLINGNVLDNDAAGADVPKGFTAWDATTANTAAIADLAKYGTLHLNTDGSWSFDLNNSLAAVQALKGGQVISDSITYTMHDADGDTSGATLKITINGADDTAHVYTAAASGPDATVAEHGLVAADGTQSASGTFTVSATDGIHDVVFTNPDSTFTTLSADQLNALSTTHQDVNTGEGILHLTGYDSTTGVVNYTYTLAAAIDNAGHPGATGTYFDDSVHITVNGIGGTTAGDDLVIRITDDTPTAANDNPAGVTEDAATHLINGNVLDNDAAGADVPKGFTAWDATTANTAAIADLAKYGTLHLNTDGSWSFDLNNSLAAVQALKGGQVISDSITYTMHDADGDTSGATLKITINGADDTAHVYTAAASGPDATVAEHGLVAADGTQSASGTFTVSATDGIHDVVFTNPDSTFTTLSADQLNALSTTHQDVNTGEGILHLTGYDSTTGVVNYTYTLAAAIDNAGHPGATGTYFDDSVHITVNGIGGTTAGDDLVIRITDDTPTAANDNPAGVTEDAATHLINGNVLDNDAAGADVPKGFTAWDATTANTAAIADLAKYGTLHLNTDGSWSFDLNNSLAAVQALKGGQVISDSITYTMHDADGDTSGATLKITINGADDTAHVYTAAASGPDATVAEHGLVAADGTQSASGTFTVSATDGIHDVVFTNPDSTFTTLSADQLNALSTTHQDVNTGEGILHLTGYDSTTGVVNYTYTLAAAIDNAGHPGATGTYFDDSVHITVNGIGGTTAGDDLVIRITDDTPTAANDNPAGVTEDAATHLINGNVLDNDAAGADVPKGFTAWDATTANTAAIADLAKYGTLHLNTDGSWSFDLNNSLAAVQALKGGQVISDSITYTMHDADGDTSGATLKITINGADDTAHVYTAAASGPDATVAEHGLVAADGTQSASGTFTVSATDGIHDVVFTNPDSTFTTLSADQLNALSTTHQDVNTGEGILHLTGYDSTTGVVNYTYTLAAAIDNAGHPGATGTYFDDSVHITVNGIGGTTAGDDLVIRITDDTPTAANDNPAGVTEDAATHLINGNVLDNDAAGADVPKGFTAWDATTANTAAIADLAKYGTLHLNTDGSWSFDLNNSLAAVQALKGGQVISDSITYTMHDADGDTSGATLKITINGADDTAHVTADASGTDVTVYEHGLTSVLDTSETAGNHFTVSATDGISTVDVGGHTFTLAQLQSYSTSSPSAGFTVGDGTMSLTGYNAATGAVSYTYTLNHALTHPLPGADIITENVAVTVNGIGGTTASANLAIKIVDDVPTAGDQSVTVHAGTGVGTNLLLIVDTTGSMGDNPGVTGYATKLALEKAALDQLITEYESHGDVMVRLVTFHDSDATIVGSGWMTASQAITAINGLTASGNTNYDAALLNAQTAFNTAGAIAAGQNVSYFLSDGVPNVSTSWPGVSGSGANGINAAEQTAWEAFLHTHQITSFALGLGSSTTVSALDPIAYDGVHGTQMPTDASGNDGTVITDLSQLSSDLVATVIAPTVVTGNLITGGNVSFGADGPAALKIASIAHDTNGNGVIDSNEVYNTSSTGYNAATTTLTITTHDGGTLAVNFSTGDYTYTNPTAQPVNTNTNEVFAYTVVDHDGDKATANLTITIHGEDAPTAGAQSVIAEAGAGVGTNLLLMIDTTGSMSDSSGVKDAQGNVMSKLALEKAALDQLITEYESHGDVMVRLVTFHDGTSEIVGSGWMTASQAITTINGLTASGNTNYDAALLNAQTAFNTTGAIAGGQNISYFLSDGVPNVATKWPSNLVTNDATDNGINAAEQTAWETFLHTHQITSFALGLGSSTTVSTLDPIAYDGVHGTQMPTDASGNDATVITDLSQLSSDLLATVITPVHVTGNLITGGNVSFGADGPAALKIASIAHDTNGNGVIDSNEVYNTSSTGYNAATTTLTITTHDGGTLAVNFSTGDYNYTSSTHVTTDTSEIFKYTVADGNGDTASSNLTIYTLSQTTTQDYSASASGVTATSTVDHPNIIGSAHDDILTGDSHDNILVGGAGNDALSGGAGNNILSGGSGADTFVISSGAKDTIQDYSKVDGDKVDISSVLNTSAGDHLDVIKNADGSVKLEILNSSNVEKASVSFENIHFSDLTPGHELDSLLGKVDVHHS